MRRIQLVTVCLLAALSQSLMAQDDTSGQSGVQAVSVVAYSWGFDLKSVTLTSGEFYMLLRHLATDDQLDVSIQSDSGDSITSATLTHPVPSRVLRLSLKPGKYHLREANHPAWQAEIVVGGAN